MRLNPDCIRDLLMGLEQLSDTGRVTYIFDNIAAVQKHLHLESYSTNEIEYHLRQCEMNGMLVGAKFGSDGCFAILDISPKAHEFLANIRDDKQWGAVKKGLSAIRNYSLSAIGAIAEGVTSSAINAYFSGQTNP